MARSTPELLTYRAYDLGEKLKAARKQGSIAGATDIVALLPEVMRLLEDMAHEIERLEWTVTRLKHADEDDDG
jgi:hypothetical protein